MTKEETETYDTFTDLLETLGNFFGIEEDKVVKFIYSFIDNKKSGFIISKSKIEEIKWCCFRFNSLRRKQINAERNV